MLEDPLGSNEFNCLAKMRDGWMLYNKNDSYIGASIRKYGEWSHSEMNIFQQILKEGNYVVEVGANIGSHTLGISKLVGLSGKIYAYEPQRIIFQTLCANMALNSRTNVYCFEQAASDTKEIITVPDIDYSQQANFGAVSIEQFSTGAALDVVILDDELKDIARLDLLKIDAEGMEYKALNGAKILISKYKPILYVENDRPEKSQALIELIQSMDYKLYWHRAPIYNPNNYAENEENIFEDQISLNMICFPTSTKTNMAGFTEIVDSTIHPVTRVSELL
jgi:FkbM family methyltransferase